MSENRDLKEIPADLYQIELPFSTESSEVEKGIMHKDFVLTHPAGKYPVCGHKIRGNDEAMAGRSFCLIPSGSGTIHLGIGYCSKHDTSLSNIKSGRYSKYLTGVLSDRLETFMEDPEILSLNEEISLMRAVLSELLSIKESIEKSIKELIQNSPSNDASQNEKDKYENKISTLEKKYKSMLYAIQDAIERTSKIIETKNKIESGEKYTIHVQNLQVVVVQMVNIIKKYVNDPEIQFKIGKELSQLRIPTKEHKE